MSEPSFFFFFFLNPLQDHCALVTWDGGRLVKFYLLGVYLSVLGDQHELVQGSSVCELSVTALKNLFIHSSSVSKRFVLVRV